MDDRPAFKFNADNTRDSGCKKVYFPKRDKCKVQQYKRQQQLKYPFSCIYIPTLQLLPQPPTYYEDICSLRRLMQQINLFTHYPGTAAAKLQLTPLQEHWENAGAARAYQMNPPSGSC